MISFNSSILRKGVKYTEPTFDSSCNLETDDISLEDGVGFFPRDNGYEWQPHILEAQGEEPYFFHFQDEWIIPYRVTR